MVDDVRPSLVMADADYPSDLDDDLFNEDLDSYADYGKAFEERGWEVWCAWGGGEW